MANFDVPLPPLLAELHEYEFQYEDGSGIDFEGFDEFLDAEETAEWLQAWTGNDDVDGAEYRIFGEDGTGGYAAFWLVRKGRPVLEQPIVFFGSEGELGVVAFDFADYLWLLAAGVGPYEAIGYGPDSGDPDEEFEEFAEEHALAAKKSPAEVLARAKEAFPSFADDIRALCP